MWFDAQEGARGLTIRDWFAGMALSGLVSQPPLNPTEDAKWAYVYADAMLEQREQQP